MTEAKVIASALGTRMIRLQCYEGLDINQAVYEWNYTRQIMHIRLMEARGERVSESELFGPEYLHYRQMIPCILPIGYIKQFYKKANSTDAKSRLAE